MWSSHNVICNYVLYDYNYNGCIYGNTSNGPKCVMWHQEVGKLTFLAQWCCATWQSKVSQIRLGFLT